MNLFEQILVGSLIGTIIGQLVLAPLVTAILKRLFP